MEHFKLVTPYPMPIPSFHRQRNRLRDYMTFSGNKCVVIYLLFGPQIPPALIKDKAQKNLGHRTFPLL